MQLEHALMAVRARLLADPAPDLLRAELQRAQNIARVLRAQRGVAAQVPSVGASAANAANANVANVANPTGGKTVGRAPSPAPSSVSAAAAITAAPSTNTIINQIAQIYGGAVAALKLRDNAAALSLAQTALDATQVMRFSPTVQSQYAQLAIDSAVSEAALATGDAQRARQVMQPYVQGSRSDRAAVLQWVATLRAPGTPAAELARASEQLQSWVAQNPNDAGMWEALASVYEVQNQPLRAIRASAEARVALLDYSAALDRFKAGQALARQTPGSDHIELSILDTRARAVQALVRGQQRDDKED
jgi:predicted Zn-dependent protease